MILTTEQDTQLERINRANEIICLITSAQLVATETSANTPWLAYALSELWRLQRTGADLPGVGDLRINGATVDCVGRVLGSIKHRLLPVPSVGPISGGGVAIIWEVKGREIELLVLPNDQVLLSQNREGEPVKSSIELRPNEYDKVNAELAELSA